LINKKFSRFTATTPLFSEHLQLINKNDAVLVFGCKFSTKFDTGKKKMNIFVFLSFFRNCVKFD